MDSSAIFFTKTFKCRDFRRGCNWAWVPIQLDMSKGIIEKNIPSSRKRKDTGDVLYFVLQKGTKQLAAHVLG